MSDPQDIFDRLMELWEQPWSELAFGEAQILVARLRTVLAEAAPVPLRVTPDPLARALRNLVEHHEFELGTTGTDCLAEAYRALAALEATR